MALWGAFLATLVAGLVALSAYVAWTTASRKYRWGWGAQTFAATGTLAKVAQERWQAWYHDDDMARCFFHACLVRGMLDVRRHNQTTACYVWSCSKSTLPSSTASESEATCHSALASR